MDPEQHNHTEPGMDAQPPQDEPAAQQGGTPEGDAAKKHTENTMLMVLLAVFTALAVLFAYFTAVQINQYREQQVPAAPMPEPATEPVAVESSPEEALAELEADLAVPELDMIDSEMDALEAELDAALAEE